MIKDNSSIHSYDANDTIMIIMVIYYNGRGDIRGFVERRWIKMGEGEGRKSETETQRDR